MLLNKNIVHCAFSIKKIVHFKIEINYVDVSVYETMEV